MITGINESKTLKHIPYECKCTYDGKNCNSDYCWNNDKCWCVCKKRHVCEKDYFWNPAKCNCENGQYLASIIDDYNAAVICDKITEETVPTNFNENKATCRTQIFYILLVFLLATIALLIAVSTYCYLIKHQAKQKHFLANICWSSRRLEDVFNTSSI